MIICGKYYRIDPKHFIDIKYTKTLEDMIKKCQKILATRKDNK